MALKGLKDVEQINDTNVIIMDQLKEKMPDLFKDGVMDWKYFEENIRPNYPIQIRLDKNSISFTLQNGPAKEVGTNGCQVDALIETAKMIIEAFNKNMPCRENAMVITKLDEALLWSERRRAEREKRGVEGYNKI